MDAENQQPDIDIRRRGAIILAAFAIVWAMAGSTGITDPATSRILFGTAAVVSVLVAALALRSGRRPSAARPRLAVDWRQQYGRVAIAQMAGIGVVVFVFLSVGARSLLPVAVSVVVGAHFLPLARILDQPQYRRTGTSLIAVAAAGLVAVATRHGAAAIAIVGFGASAVLCATALLVGVPRSPTLPVRTPSSDRSQGPVEGS